MSKITLAFGSFVVGATFGSLALSLVQASTSVQASQGTPQTPESTINIAAAIPVVPPLMYFGHGDMIGGNAQQLDGFSCDGCTVTAGILIYGGGSFSLSNTRFPRNVGLHLTGAALNTFNLLRVAGVIPNPTPVPHVPPPGSAVQRAELEIKAQDNPISLISLEGVKK